VPHHQLVKCEGIPCLGEGNKTLILGVFTSFDLRCVLSHELVIPTNRLPAGQKTRM
jgi:hypothetical protein